MGFDPKIFALLAFGLIVHGVNSSQNRVTASGTQDPNCTLTTNPDITGIGVRIAFYIQGLLTILGPRFFDDEQKEGTFRNAFFTSVALTISTFIYGRTPAGLSLLDGLIVTFLPYVITIGAANNTLTLFLGKTELKVAYLLHLVVCVAFGLTVWTHVDTYGTTPGCNLNSLVKFVVFGHSVAATSKGLRGFGIFVFALIAALLPFAAIPLLSRNFSTLSSLLGDRSGSKIGLLFAWVWTFLLSMVWVYEVVTIEQIIQRNGVAHMASQWTYGQTFALVLVLGPIFDFGSAVRKTWKGNQGTVASSLPNQAAKFYTLASYPFLCFSFDDTTLFQIPYSSPYPMLTCIPTFLITT